MPSRVAPAIPILFFGDVDTYCASPTRLLTVGLNPSSEEFPAGRPFQRFPLASTVTATDQDRYVRALSAYFRTDPYDSWFRNFEPLLTGARSNYYPAWASTVLHTDICSPVATNPRWSKLPQADQETLKMYGLPLWHALLEQLRPHIVVLRSPKIIWTASCSTRTVGGESCTPSTGPRAAHPAHVLTRFVPAGTTSQATPASSSSARPVEHPSPSATIRNARWVPSPARHGMLAYSHLTLPEQSPGRSTLIVGDRTDRGSADGSCKRDRGRSQNTKSRRHRYFYGQEPRPDRRLHGWSNSHLPIHRRVPRISCLTILGSRLTTGHTPG